MKDVRAGYIAAMERRAQRLTAMLADWKGGDKGFAQRELSALEWALDELRPRAAGPLTDTERLNAIERLNGAHLMNWGAGGDTGNPWTADPCDEDEITSDIGRFEGKTLRDAIDAMAKSLPSEGGV